MSVRPSVKKILPQDSVISDETCSICYICVFCWYVTDTTARRMWWAGHVACMGERRGVYRVLVGKLERKRPLGRHRRRWEDNIKMDLQEVVRGGVDWIELVKVRDRWRVLVNAVMNFRVPQNAGNFFTC